MAVCDWELFKVQTNLNATMSKKTNKIFVVNGIPFIITGDCLIMLKEWYWFDDEFNVIMVSFNQ